MPVVIADVTLPQVLESVRLASVSAVAVLTRPAPRGPVLARPATLLARTGES